MGRTIRRSSNYPSQIVRQRFVAASFLMNRMLAIVEEIMQTKKGRDAALDRDIRIANVVDMMVGVFDAPISPTAIQALDAVDRAGDSSEPARK
jgi:hypothetical protein